MKERQSPIPVALYARVYRDRNDVELSVADQLSALRDYANGNDYAVVREYVDETKAQEITSSPQFHRMVAEAGQTDAPFREILIWGSSRLPRPGERAFAARSGLTANGIRVVAIEVHPDDSHTGVFVEEMDESTELFLSRKLDPPGLPRVCMRQHRKASGCPAIPHSATSGSWRRMD